MEIEALRALVADGGGYGNVVRLIFDNNIHVSFIRASADNKLKETDFVELGGTWFYKEPTVFRNNNTYEYDVKSFIYHPLDCLQAVIMTDSMDKLDILQTTDMLAQLTS